ncbi:MAG: hypothetical protein HZC55_04030 [Verrucomicrobia bacterium]|nr:hypothetical protein [Verrucomicrobiota bacterium]
MSSASPSPSILRPEITVTLSTGPVVVRDLPWQDALEFLRRLSLQAKEILAHAVSPDTGRIDLAQLLPKLSDLVSGAGELSLFLLTRSTGKDEEWLRQHGTLETLALLDAALEVNLSDGLIELGKKAAGRLARVMPATSTTSATPPSATS